MGAYVYAYMCIYIRETPFFFLSLLSLSLFYFVVDEENVT